jgi:hypothetical protein
MNPIWTGRDTPTDITYGTSPRRKQLGSLMFKIN